MVARGQEQWGKAQQGEVLKRQQEYRCGTGTVQYLDCGNKYTNLLHTHTQAHARTSASKAGEV